jgi:hypothetical protein
MIGIRALISLVCLLSAFAARGGVDGGNPRRQPFYDMAENYRIVDTDLVATPVGAGGGVRLEGPLIYRDLGYFVIEAGNPATSTGETVCGQHRVRGTRVTVYWVGRDCVHAYFKRKFAELEGSVQKLLFAQ